jgi:hypothetical protein
VLVFVFVLVHVHVHVLVSAFGRAGVRRDIALC